MSQAGFPWSRCWDEDSCQVVYRRMCSPRGHVRGSLQGGVWSQGKYHRGWSQPDSAGELWNVSHTSALSCLSSWKLDFCFPTRATCEGMKVPGTFHALGVNCGQSGSCSLRAGLWRRSLGAGSWKQMQTEATGRAYKGRLRGSGWNTEHVCCNTITTNWFPLCSEGSIISILTKISELLRCLCDILGVSCTQEISASICIRESAYVDAHGISQRTWMHNYSELVRVVVSSLWSQTYK